MAIFNISNELYTTLNTFITFEQMPQEVIEVIGQDAHTALTTHMINQFMEVVTVPDDLILIGFTKTSTGQLIAIMQPESNHKETILITLCSDPFI